VRVTDRSPTGRRLQTVFIPAEPKPVMPTEISDEIVLTHPVMPPMVGLKEGRFRHFRTTGAAGATEILGAQVPTDFYWWIQAVSLFHTDTVADRILRLQMLDTSANRVTILQDRVAVGADLHLVLERPFLLPNDTRLVASVDGLGAGFALTLEFFRLEFLHAEINPQL